MWCRRRTKIRNAAQVLDCQLPLLRQLAHVPVLRTHDFLELLQLITLEAQSLRVLLAANCRLALASLVRGEVVELHAPLVALDDFAAGDAVLEDPWCFLAAAHLSASDSIYHACDRTVVQNTDVATRTALQIIKQVDRARHMVKLR